MATVTRYVDLNSTAGGDGTTNATSGSNRAYASLAEWLSAEGTDLVAAGDSHVCIVAAGEYAETLTLSGGVWNCDASNTLTLRAATGDECTTLDFSNGVRLVANPGGTSGVLVVSAAYTRVIGIGVYATGGNTESSGFRISGNSSEGRVIERCIARGSTHGTSNAFKQSADAQVKYFNCIAVDSGGEGWDIDNFDDARLYNCLAINNGSHGFFRSGTSGTRPRAINCVAFGNGGSGFSGAFNTTLSSNNASDDATSAGVSVVDDALVSGDFADSAGGDFSPSAGSSLRGAGVDLSSDFTTDFLGVTRSAWDIGPYEYAAAGSPPSGTVTISTVDPAQTTAEVMYSYNDTDETGYEYRLNGGTAASLDASPATITGLTASTTYNIEVRAINGGGVGAWSTPFEFTTDTAGSPPAGTVTISTVDPAQTTAEVTYSYNDTDQTGFEYRIDLGTAAAIGASPATITGLTAATTYDIEVRAVNAGGAGAWSTAFEFTTDSEAAANTVTVTEPLKNNTGTLHALETGITVSVLDAATLVSVYETTGLTTNSSGILEPITDVAITASSSYHVAIKLADGSVGITGPITAT